jgi:hypothetical protein
MNNLVKFIVTLTVTVSSLSRINAQDVVSEYWLKRDIQGVVNAFGGGWDAVKQHLMTNYDCQQIKATQLMSLLSQNQKEAMEAMEALPKDVQFPDYIFNPIKINGIQHLIGFVVATTVEGLAIDSERRHTIGRPLLFAKVGDKWKLYWVAKHWYYVTFDEENVAFATDGGGTYKVPELIEELESEIRSELEIKNTQDVMEAFTQGWDAVKPYLMTNYDCQQIKALQLMSLLSRNQKETMEAIESLPKDARFADYIFNRITINNVQHLIGFVIATTAEGVSMGSVRRHTIGRPLLFAEIEGEWKLYWVAKHWYYVTFDDEDVASATDGGGTYKIHELLRKTENEIKELE